MTTNDNTKAAAAELRSEIRQAKFNYKTANLKPIKISHGL